MTLQVACFGTTPDGTTVDRVLRHGRGLSAHILTYSVTLQDLRLEGVTHPLVLGSPTLDPYFGAIVGRFANRISNATFDVGGHPYHTDPNWLGRHTLHGGASGSGQQMWTIGAISQCSVRMDLTLADGDMGFPGEMSVSAEYALLDHGVLSVDIRATTTAVGPCSFSHHSYFNLDGCAVITAHTLQVDADHYLPVTAEMLPTGDIAPVTGSRFDFHTNARRLTYLDAFNTASPETSIQASHVIGNAAVPLIAEMLPEPHRADLQKQIAPLEHACSLLTVYIGFKGDLKTLGSKHYSTFILPDDLTSLHKFNENCHDEFDKRGFVFVDY